jgi:SpoVK/Ycf46/Vps4 family AAA+-type ATPase
VVFLATTNYPERLGPRIINRPSRFDKRFKIGHPKAAARKLYLEHVIGNGDVEKGRAEAKRLGVDLKQWVKDTAEMSLAHLKELFIAVLILKDPYEEAIETLKSMKEEIEDKEYGNFGFEVSDSNKDDDLEEIKEW